MPAVPLVWKQDSVPWHKRASPWWSLASFLAHFRQCCRPVSTTIALLLSRRQVPSWVAFWDLSPGWTDGSGCSKLEENRQYQGMPTSSSSKWCVGGSSRSIRSVVESLRSYDGHLAKVCSSLRTTASPTENTTSRLLLHSNQQPLCDAQSWAESAHVMAQRMNVQARRSDDVRGRSSRVIMNTYISSGT